MDTPNELARHAAGIGGVAVSLLLSLKEGWRVIATKAVAGLVMVYLLRGVAEDSRRIVVLGIAQLAAGPNAPGESTFTMLPLELRSI